MDNELPDVLRLGIPEIDMEHLLQVQILASMLEAFAADVRSGAFPAAAESFEDPSVPRPQTIERLYGA